MKKIILIFTIALLTACQKDSELILGDWYIDKMEGYSIISADDSYTAQFKEDGKLIIQNKGSIVKNTTYVFIDTQIKIDSKIMEINIKRKSMKIYGDIISNDPASTISPVTYLSKK